MQSPWKATVASAVLCSEVHLGRGHGSRGVHWHSPNDRDIRLAKPNYSFEKRQREIAKKKQQDEKDARKREAREAAKAAAEPAPLKPASDGG